MKNVKFVLPDDFADTFSINFLSGLNPDGTDPDKFREFQEQIAAMTKHDANRWANPPHKTHLCRTDQGGCGNEWKPFDYPTNGVAPE